MALGAAPWEVARMFLGRTVILTGLALAIGLGASVVLGRTVESLLFGVRATIFRRWRQQHSCWRSPR